jgi:hypothetical protein
MARAGSGLIGFGQEGEACGVYPAAQGLQKLNDRHRRAAHLLVQGMTFVEISREVGCHSDHCSRFAKDSPMFQTYLESCREVPEHIYLTSTERLSSGTIERKLEKCALQQRRRQERQQRYRQGKSASPRLPDQAPASPSPGIRVPGTAAPRPPAQQTGPEKANSEVAWLESEIARVRAELDAERRRQQPFARPSLGATRATGGLYTNAQGLSGRRR